MQEPRGQELINRYKQNYCIPDNAIITEEMILRHWELEKVLATKCLESTKENRWAIFERCYYRLYKELPWLNELVGTDRQTPPSLLYKDWAYLIGSPPKRVYEIGSGKAEMIKYLADYGFMCRATEITQERGDKWVEQHPNLSWGITDGVHLGEFEPLSYYDAVISDSVIEHLHFDDIIEHFRGVHFILRKGGQYIFRTPHNYFGPCDVSWVFKCEKPRGMHLKEYTYYEIKEALIKSGFNQIYAVIRIPNISIIRWLGALIKTRPSRNYLNYSIFVEKMVSVVPEHRFRRAAAQFAQLAFFLPSIFVVARKD